MRPSVEKALDCRYVVLHFVAAIEIRGEESSANVCRPEHNEPSLQLRSFCGRRRVHSQGVHCTDDVACGSGEANLVSLRRRFRQRSPDHSSMPAVYLIVDRQELIEIQFMLLLLVNLCLETLCERTIVRD